MPLSLLQIIQKAQAELGLPQATSVVGNTDPSTIQMFALANRVVDELRQANPTGWTALQFEYDLVVPVPITVTGNLTTNFTNTISGIPSTAGILANYFYVSGTNLIQGTRVQQVIDANTIKLNQEATNSQAVTGGTFQFAQDTFPEPSGFDWFQNRTMWDRTNHWELLGPTSPQLDQWYNSGIVTTGPRRHFRQKGPFANNFVIWPPPLELTSPLQLVFEYLSSHAVSSLAQSGSPPNPPIYTRNFVNDTDSPLLDSEAIVTGIKWMFWEIKGMGSYVTLQNRWVDYVDRLIARDGSAPTLQLAKRVSPTFISPSNVQDGFFPGPIGPNAS
jgi:hypothetical protein